jgi:hypothetical protein
MIEDCRLDLRGNPVWVRPLGAEQAVAQPIGASTQMYRRDGYQGAWQFRRLRLNLILYRIRAQIVRATSQSSRCQLLFVDGDHSYKACSRDVRLYGKWLDIAGTLTLHDATTELGCPRPIKVAGQLLRDPGWKFFLSYFGVPFMKENKTLKPDRRDTNLGLAASRNTVLQAGHAPFTLCVDADDFLRPEFLSATLDVIGRALELCRQRFFCQPRIRYFGENVQSIPRSATVDVIVANRIFQHILDDAEFGEARLSGCDGPLLLH